MLRLYIITASCACLSFIGCLFILIVYAMAAEIRVYAFKLVAYLAFCDLIKSAAIILPGYNEDLMSATCKVQGFLLTSFSLSNLVWILGISFSLFKVIVHKHENIEIYHKKWLVLAFIVSPTLSSLPFIFGGYGEEYSWCTLKTLGSGEKWKIAIDFVPKWGSIILIVFCYLKLYFHIKKNSELFEDAATRKLFLKRMIVYPIIILIAFIPIAVLRTLQIFYGECGFFALATIAYGCFGIYGFLNALAYGYNESIHNYIRKKCCKSSKLSRNQGTDLFRTLSKDAINS